MMLNGVFIMLVLFSMFRCVLWVIWLLVYLVGRVLVLVVWVVISEDCSFSVLLVVVGIRV